MGNLKKNKSAVKESLLLSVISKYHFLVIAILVQTFLLLLVSLAAELYPILDVEHANLINLISIVTAAICILVHALGWDQPMSNVVPLIIISIWFLLSTQNSLYCICCSSPSSSTAATLTNSVHHHSFIAPYHPPLPSPPSVTVTATTTTGGKEEGGELEKVVAKWEEEDGCNEKDFQFAYALVGFGLFLVSFFNDIRNYYLSALNRIMTLCAFFILLIFLIISPSSSSQFDLNHALLIVMRITVYHILWFATQYKSIIEQLLILHYKDTLKKAKHSPLLYRENGKKTSIDTSLQSPVAILLEIDEITKKIRNYRTHQATVTPMITENANNTNITERKSFFNRYIEKMSEINHTCYAGAWLMSLFSWKNRHASPRTQALFEVIQILWVLVVPPLWLLILSPLTFLWLLCQIHTSTNELPHTLKTSRILNLISPS